MILAKIKRGLKPRSLKALPLEPGYFFAIV